MFHNGIKFAIDFISLRNLIFYIWISGRHINLNIKAVIIQTSFIQINVSNVITYRSNILFKRNIFYLYCCPGAKNSKTVRDGKICYHTLYI